MSSRKRKLSAADGEARKRREKADVLAEMRTELRGEFTVRHVLNDGTFGWVVRRAAPGAVGPRPQRPRRGA